MCCSSNHENCIRRGNRRENLGHHSLQEESQIVPQRLFLFFLLVCVTNVVRPRRPVEGRKLLGSLSPGFAAGRPPSILIGGKTSTQAQQNGEGRGEPHMWPWKKVISFGDCYATFDACGLLLPPVRSNLRLCHEMTTKTKDPSLPLLLQAAPKGAKRSRKVLISQDDLGAGAARRRSSPPFLLSLEGDS